MSTNVSHDVSSATNYAETPKCSMMNTFTTPSHDETTSNVHHLQPPDLGNKISGPSQPCLAAFPKTLFSNRYRSFTTELYARFPFVEYSISRDAVFCFACRHFCTNSGKSESNFTHVGVRHWQAIWKKTEKHAKSNIHKHSMISWESYKSVVSTGSVAAQLSCGHMKLVKENREYMEKIYAITLFLSKQGLAFRGHDEGSDSEKNGNFQQLCQLISSIDPSFSTKQKATFNLSSPQIQNELIEVAASATKRLLVKRVLDTGFYCLLADEARTFKQEMLAICIRFTRGLDVEERFIGFYDCSLSQTAESLHQIVEKALEEIGLASVPIIAQGYDGASVMSGNVQGLQRLVQRKHPAAQYVHCMAHRLNLVVVDVCRANRAATRFFDSLQSLYTLCAHPQVHARFQQMVRSMKIKHLEISSLSETRWACRYKTVTAVKQQFNEILQVLLELEREGCKCTTQVSGIIRVFNTTEFRICLCIFDRILPLVHVAHKALQAESATLNTAASVISSVLIEVRRLRSDNVWQDILDGSDSLSLNAAKCSSDSAQPKRFKPNAYHSQAACYLGQRDTEEQSSDSHRLKVSVFFPVIDRLVSELERRFNKQTLDLAAAVDGVLHSDAARAAALLDRYADVLNIDRQLALVEMNIAKNLLQPDCQEPLNTLKSIVSSASYPNFFKLLQVALTIPVGSSKCERSISAMRRVRNYLRMSMGQDRFTQLSMLAIERDLVSQLTLSELVDTFAEQKSRRIVLT